MAEMVRDGGDFNAINLGGQGAGQYAIGPSYLDGPDGWDGPPYNGMLGLYAHEVGHTLDLRHAPCGGTEFNAPEYPYPNGGLGGARSWHPWFEEFVDRDSAYSDLMSYCHPQTLSDYHYQHAVMYLQGPHYAEWKREADACWEEDADATGVRSLAVVGRVAPDGTSTIVGTASSPHPPGTTGGTGVRDGWSLSVLDAGGTVVFRQSLTLESHGHHHNATLGRVWRARIPYPAAADMPELLLVVRGADGAVRVQEPLRAVR